MAQRQAGFTLLEMIGAIAILAISFAVLLQALGTSVNLTQKAGRRTEAALVAQSVLDSAFVLSAPESGMRQGRSKDGFDWQLQTRLWPGAAASQTSDLRLYQLQLTVNWGPRGRRRHAHFSTLRVAEVADHRGAGG